MDRRSQARAVRTILLALFVVSISLVGGMVTAFAADLAQAAGAAPAIQRLLIVSSAALTALAGVRITVCTWWF